jgi:hypothetical protein
MDESIKTDITVVIVVWEILFKDKHRTFKDIQFLNAGKKFCDAKEDWTLNIGAAVFYSLDNENSNNKLYILNLMLLTK